VPQFMNPAACEMVRTGADYLQFPKSYRHTVYAAPGFNIEF